MSSEHLPCWVSQSHHGCLMTPIDGVFVLLFRSNLQTVCAFALSVAVISRFKR